MTRVLVIDDEPQIVRALRINLSVRGYEVITASTGAGALRAAAEHKPDVVILDLGLPDISGIEVLGGLRGWLTAPVIVLSARTDSSDKVEALDAGADDYVTKPFGMDEFLARLRAAVRRNAAASDTDQPVVETEAFHRRSVRQKGHQGRRRSAPHPTQWGMLEVLVRNRGKLVGREELLKEVWGPAYATETHYLRVYLAQLQHKLEDDPSHPKHLLRPNRAWAIASRRQSLLPHQPLTGGDTLFARLQATIGSFAQSQHALMNPIFGATWHVPGPIQALSQAGALGHVRSPTAVRPIPLLMVCRGRGSHASRALRSIRR